ncbi:hypothetical protein, partial [Xanthomonas citri]|uniref:hypothetical protein n=1 Tax=Xanthomonas citri TaxID=346 RepID=UPI001E30AADB
VSHSSRSDALISQAMLRATEFRSSAPLHCVFSLRSGENDQSNIVSSSLANGSNSGENDVRAVWGSLLSRG